MKINARALTYNICITSGVGLIAAGTASRWGWPIGAICAGVVIIGLTIFATLISRPRQS